MCNEQIGVVETRARRSAEVGMLEAHHWSLATVCGWRIVLYGRENLKGRETD